MSEEEKRKQQFVALKRYLEKEEARADREMPGATVKEKTDAVAAKLSDSLAVSRERKVVGNLTAVLRGKKLQREQNQSVRDYSGGGFYHEDSETLHLFADHTFRYEKRRFSAISSGSPALPPSEQKRVEEGTWGVEIIEEVPHLVLRMDGSVCKSWRTRDGGVGVQCLNEERWERYKM